MLTVEGECNRLCFARTEVDAFESGQILLVSSNRTDDIARIELYYLVAGSFSGIGHFKTYLYAFVGSNDLR